MKKVLLFGVMCLMALTMQAQRCAVFQFNAGTGLTQESVDGIFYIFTSNFYPQDYTMLERADIDKTIKKFDYPRTNMKQQEMLRVGRTLNASIIVVGEMTIFMDEYNVDVRAIDVATGATVASESASFERTKYRDNMKKVAQRLAYKLSKKER